MRPLLVETCGRCHGSTRTEGDLRLDSRESLLRGGRSGPAIVPGDPGASLLLRAIRRESKKIAMPPKRVLGVEVVAAVESWIAGGAPWPSVGSIGNPLDRLDEIRREHWAFRAIRNVDVPSSSAWATSPIDAFVERRLAREKLVPSPRADARTLIRRLYATFAGVPPRYHAIESFAADPSADAFDRTLDDLLSRPSYGERWGRHWLDVARYADTKGYVDAGERFFPFAYTYRDYVIRAFDDDLPFDRFVREQIAADSISPHDKSSLAALGFLTVGQRFNFFPHEILDDRIDVVTRGFMGLTVSCARCHDHKYDPISTEDYYALHGIFANSIEVSPDEWPQIARDQRADSDSLQAKLTQKGQAYRERRKKLHDQIRYELRAWAGDYLRYLVELMPAHRTQPQPPLRSKRGLLREASAYARGAIVRWRRYIASRGENDRVFGLWNRAVALPRGSFATRFPALVETQRKRAELNDRLWKNFVSKPARSMRELAEVYGRELERVEADYRAQGGSGSLADAADEELRLVLYSAESPASLTIDD
ncbi:MAG: DUF1549 domain-containing protein, partial [Planctomycetota bacterium]